MGKVSVLDCTLRDGGYVNDFQFSNKTIKVMIEKLGKSHMDIIECGFLRDEEYDKERSIYNDVKQIQEVIGKKKKHSKYVAMIVTGTFPASKVDSRCKEGIDGIRVTFHKKEMNQAFDLGYALMDKGYEVFMQPVGTTTYSDQELLNLIERINEMKPYAFYLVDTLGKLYKKQLMKLFYLVDDNLDEDIRIGYHSHNNLQLSFSNAQELIQSSGKRDLIIDASILGMGRGAGNLCSEILTQFINENMEYRYHTELLIELIDEYINPISYMYPWGYSASYFLAATNNCHPNYVTYLMNKQTLNVKSIYQILKDIPEEERALYNESLIYRLYSSYQENKVEDEAIIKEWANKIQGKTVVILAPGKSVIEEKEKIDAYMSKENLYVIAVNHVPEYIKPNLIFISNQKRYHQLKKNYGVKNLDIPLMITSNISARNIDAKVVNYADLSINDSLISDNACLMLFQLLIKVGVMDVSIAGFDGYHTNVEKNYYTENLINSADRYKLADVNKHIRKFMKKIKSQMNVQYITSSLYCDEGDLVYVPES